MGSEIVVRTHDLTKYYGPVRGVEDVRLTVRQGETFALLGPNGAGKTTIIRLLLGFIRPTAGSATIFGLDCWAQASQTKRVVAYQAAQVGLYPDATPRQLLALQGQLRGSDMMERGKELAERLQIELDRKVVTFSRGARQKVGLLLALAANAHLLVLDEPSTGLDPLMQVELVHLLREERERGRTIFLASHNLVEVERVCDRVAIIRDGRIVAIEEVAGLRRRTMRQMDLTFAAEVDPAQLALPGVTLLAAHGPRLRLGVRGPVGPLLKALAQHDVVDMTFAPPGLEELFVQYYSSGTDQPARDAP